MEKINDDLFKVNEELRLSEQKYAFAFEMNPAMMAISDVETGRYIDINQAYLETMGLSREEVIGKTSSEIGDFAGMSIDKENAMVLARNKQIRHIELDLKTRSGEIINVLVSADTFVLADKLCLITVLIDVTMRIWSMNNLAEMIRTEKEMRLAREKADMANLPWGNYLMRMCHELRTPLGGIVGYTE